jgi:prevent-host-death family protein
VEEIVMRVTSTDLQNSFGKYLRLAMDNEPVTIVKNGKAVASIVPCSDELRFGESETEYQTETGPVSYQDYLELMEKSDERYELIDGEIYPLTSPVYAHQYVLGKLYVTLSNWFNGKDCQPLFAPFDVTLIKSETNINVVQPDLLVICDPEKIGADGKYRGVPTLVVEVLSPATLSKDLVKKTELYLQTGVREYWTIDPEGITICQYVFSDKDIADYRVYIGDSVIQSACFPGLEVRLNELFLK